MMSSSIDSQLGVKLLVFIWMAYKVITDLQPNVTCQRVATTDHMTQTRLASHIWTMTILESDISSNSCTYSNSGIAKYCFV